MATPFEAQLTNCFIMGEERSQGIRGLPDTIRARLGRYRVTIQQEQSACRPPTDEQKGLSLDTTLVTVHNLPDGEHSRGERIAHDIAALLSFATMSQVRARAFWQGQSDWAYSTVGQSVYFRPTLNTHNGGDVRRFLESAWPTYRLLRGPRKLNVVIEYIVSADIPGQPLEASAIQALVALECLKAAWAAHKGIPFVEGLFRAPAGWPRKKAGRRLSIEDLVRAAFAEVGMQRGIRRLVNVRNALVHGGLVRCRFETLEHYYEQCHDLVREYLLRLLGYSGEFYRYSRSEALVNLPPRAR